MLPNELWENVSLLTGPDHFWKFPLIHRDLKLPHMWKLYWRYFKEDLLWQGIFQISGRKAHINMDNWKHDFSAPNWKDHEMRCNSLAAWELYSKGHYRLYDEIKIEGKIGADFQTVVKYWLPQNLAIYWKDF